MRKLLLLGGGGHCKSVLDSLGSDHVYDVIKIIDVKSKVGSDIMGYQIAGTDDDLQSFYEDGFHEAFITAGSVGDTTLRKKLVSKTEAIGYSFPTITDPTAIVSEHAQLEEGCYLAKGAIVNAGVTIGKQSIVNTGTILEHDCKVGDFSHIAPSATVLGGVTIGEQSHIGTGSLLREGITIGDHVLVGMGSNVLVSVSSGLKAYGNPCKVVVK